MQVTSRKWDEEILCCVLSRMTKIEQLHKEGSKATVQYVLA